MSEIMLHAVLQMSPDMWDGGAIDVAQRHGRYIQASNRIIELSRALKSLLDCYEKLEAGFPTGYEFRVAVREHAKNVLNDA